MLNRQGVASTAVMIIVALNKHLLKEAPMRNRSTLAQHRLTAPFLRVIQCILRLVAPVHALARHLELNIMMMDNRGILTGG